MKVLVTGDTGMLGTSLYNFLRNKKIDVVGVSRTSSINKLDLREKTFLTDLLNKIQPDIIINTAAIIDLKYCEDNKQDCLKTNFGIVKNLCKWAKVKKKKIVQISTDQFFSDSEKKRNSEDAAVNFVNYYGYSKFLAEKACLEDSNSLVLRTNIIGRKESGNTLCDWILDSIIKRKTINLFTDYFTSSIDVLNFSKILFILLKKKSNGIFNLASSDVFSKKVLIEEFSKQLSIKLIKPKYISAKKLVPKRSLNCGLDISKLKKTIGFSPPKLSSIVESILKYDKIITYDN